MLRVYDITTDEVRECTQTDLDLLQLCANVLGRVWIAETQCEDYESIIESLEFLHQEFRSRRNQILMQPEAAEGD